jgi:hypothetical protein
MKHHSPKQKSPRRLSTIGNQNGILTLDFIFALMIGMSFTMIFFALTLTLSLVEVTQYMSFSVARASWAAHENRQAQIALGNAKYAELRDKPVFRTIFGQGWFRLPARPDFGDPVRGFNTEYQPAAQNDNETFFGARLRIEARILDINIPLLGSSKTNPETGVANVQTFLGREVTTTECREQFNRQRWSNILQLSPAYQEVTNYVSGDPSQVLALITDNGC